MLKKISVFGIISRILFFITIVVFMGACSDNLIGTNGGPDTNDDEVSNLTFISQLQTSGSLQKASSDDEMIYISRGGKIEIESGDDLIMI